MLQKYLYNNASLISLPSPSLFQIQEEKIISVTLPLKMVIKTTLFAHLPLVRVTGSQTAPTFGTVQLRSKT